MRLIDERRTAGVASGLDVHQAEQLLFTATGQIADLERQITQAENALSLLLGHLPGGVVRGQALEAFQVPPSVPAGLPSALLERRPDIRQAEQELIAANAQIGVAKAEYFPRISLTGFLGGQSRALSNLLTSPARVATVGLGATAPIFNAGRTRSGVKLAEAVQREALVNYQRVIYTAFRDVADSLTEYTKTNQQRTEQERWSLRCAHPQTCPPSAIEVASTAICQCSMRSGISFKGSWSSRSSASASSRRSCSCTGRSAAGGRSRDPRRTLNYEGKMAKRMILLVVLVVVFIATLAFVKFRQFQAMAAQFAAMQPPPEAVTTILAQREEWPATISAIGTVAASRASR